MPSTGSAGASSQLSSAEAAGIAVFFIIVALVSLIVIAGVLLYRYWSHRDVKETEPGDGKGSTSTSLMISNILVWSPRAFASSPQWRDCFHCSENLNTS